MRRLFALTLALAMAACASSNSPSSSSKSSSSVADAGGDAAAASDAPNGSTATDAAGMDATATTATTPEELYAGIQAGPNTLVQDGKYYLGIFAKPFSLKLFFQLYVKAEGSPTAGGKLKVFEIRGFDNETKQATEPLAVAYDVPVDPTGAFVVDFKTVTLPPKASPTGTEVPLILKLFGAVHDGQMMCGDVEGNVPQFFQDLKGSTWKAVAASAAAVKAGEAACQTVAAKVYKPVETCPAILAGLNHIQSAERDRTFQVSLPASGTPTSPVPLVFLLHGVGGNAPGIHKDTKF